MRTSLSKFIDLACFTYYTVCDSIDLEPEKQRLMIKIFKDKECSIEDASCVRSALFELMEQSKKLNDHRAYESCRTVMSAVNIVDLCTEDKCPTHRILETAKKMMHHFMMVMLCEGRG